MNTQNRIESKLAIAGANQEIKLARRIHQIDPAVMWGRFKSGNAEGAFLTAKGARDTIDLAAREVNNLAGGPPSDIAEFSSLAAGQWHFEKQGKAKKFYTNTEAKTVLTLAAAEYNTLAKTKAAAAKSATIPKGPTAPAKSSLQTDDGLTITRADFEKLPASDRAEFLKLGGKTTASAVTPPAELTGLARATQIHKAQAASAASASPVAAKPATTPTAPNSAAPALTGLARATAVHQGKAVQPSAPKELSGLARAIAIHKAQAKKSNQ